MLEEMLEEFEKPPSCNYVDAHNLSKIQNHQHGLSIIHLNISFLVSYINEPIIFFSILKPTLTLSLKQKKEYSKAIFQQPT